MKNIAILIGITEYRDKINNLPMCQNDVENIYKIISASGKYDIVEVMKCNVSSSEIRNKIIEIEKNSNEEIGELFFYFSGHGYTSSGNFYFCTSDTDVNDINSTAIAHEQIDDMIRKINPKLYVKVVDACYSSTYYIKGFNYESKMINNCYFLFSSKQTQASIASNYMSNFTKFFIEAIIKNKEHQSIKYIDICNYLADQFKKLEQTPEFVTQGDMLGEFINYSKPVKEVLNTLENDIMNSYVKREVSVQVPLEEIINTKIQKIATKDMYNEFMELVNDNINNIQIINEDLKKEFNLDLYCDKNIDDISDKAIIANWIYENKEKYNLFASSNIGQLRRILAYNLGRALEKINGKNEMENTEKIIITEDEFPFHYKIEYIPQKIGLEKYCIELIIISSPYKVYLFFKNEIYSLISWSSYELKTSSEWKKYEIEIKEKEKIGEIIEEYMNDFEMYVIKAINEYLNNLSV